jgi:alpha,alpha-trehalose phosphorylase
MDLHHLKKNTRDGVHLASLAGAWISLVAGIGGMRDHNGELSFAPRLPSRLTRLEFSLLWRGMRLHVDVRPEHATYSVRNGDATVELKHHGQPVKLTADQSVTLEVPKLSPAGPPPHQPPGRSPIRRKTDEEG